MTHAEELERRSTLLHPGLIAAGATLLVAAFVTDLLYWQTLLVQWNTMSGWLLAAGLILAALAAVAILLDLALKRVERIDWPRLGALAVAALLALLDALVHSRDAYTAVVPEGIILSGIVALILVGVGVSGGGSVAVRPDSPRPLPLRVPR